MKKIYANFFPINADSGSSLTLICSLNLKINIAFFYNLTYLVGQLFTLILITYILKVLIPI